MKQKENSKKVFLSVHFPRVQHVVATDQISFRGDADKDEIISHSHLLSLRSLL